MTDHSWIKHGLAAKVVGAQVSAHRFRFPAAKMILIDGNAGDGRSDDGSKPTPRILADLANDHGCMFCLCEIKRKKREFLKDKFPKALVVATHNEAVQFAVRGGFDYALWLSDPCGYGGHGVEHMQRLAATMPSDFVIVFNEQAVNRIIGASHSPYWREHQKYAPMREPAWWLQQLSKQFLAHTEVIRQSFGFHFRLLVASDHIADDVRRLRHIEILPLLK